jgi:superfamily II DNA or RNA helicase
MSLSKPYRYYQEEADNAIYEELLINNKCIVKMFCGTGKSLIMRNCKIIKNKKLVVFVFPSLSLITQFYEEYLNDYPSENMLKISSENESTTESNEITNFLSKQTNKIICVTYQSFQTLLDNLKDTKINVCLFDEAHHAVGETYQKLIFENNICEKQIFFTATPKNANGIIMYDRENINAGMCGKLVYDYSYLRGINETCLNPFEIRIDMYTENTNKSVFECIARSILTSDNNRVLTFHSDVNTDRDTSVKNFVNETEFKECFDKVLKNEFPEKLNKYKKNKIKMVGFYSEITPKERAKILKQFDETSDNEVIIISSCETMGEGIDTKRANMCVFVDPKSSFVKIIQNIGRVVRPQKKISTILIPCWVDKNKYLECNGDKEKCDEIIRQDMNQGGNFNGILNVLSALKQEDEDLYDICLHYPDTFSLKEIQSNLEKYGYKILEPQGDGSLLDNIGFLLDEEIDYENYEDCDTDEEMILRIAEDNDVCIEIHTNSFENQIERYNTECQSGNIIRLYKSEEDEYENPVYSPVVKKCGTKRSNGLITRLDKKNRIKVDVHTNPDVKVLWNIVNDFDITKDICSCVIDCEIEKYDPMEIAINIVERANERVKNGKNLLPRRIKNKENLNTPELEQEYKDASKLGEWKKALNGKGTSKCSNEVRDYLDSNLKGWRMNLHEQAMKHAIEIVKRANERVENEKNLLPIPRSNKNRNTPELEQEHKDASKLGKWKDALKGKGGSKCSNEVRDYLDSNLKGWREERNFDEKAIIKAVEIVKRANERFKNEKNLLPRNIQNEEKRNTPELEQEHKDFQKLGNWKQILIGNIKRSCPDNVRDYLDTNLKGWRQEQTFDEKAMKNAIEIVKRANERVKNDKNLIPRQICKKSNRNTPELEQEHKDARTLGTWKTALKGKGKSKCYNNVRDYLDIHLKGWRTTEETENKSFEEEIIINLPKEIEIIEEEIEIEFIPKKKSMKLTKTNKQKVETTEQKQTRVKSEMSQLHQRYKTLKSENLKKEFNDNPELWHKYHAISEENEKSFPNQDIPRNRVIQELDELKVRKDKVKRIVDMGCGKAQISQYFNNDKRFEFINYDHISSNDTIISCDISKIPLEDNDVDICILSLAMWGSNCEEYIQEASRILESNGLLYIIEPTKRWSDKDENGNIIEGKEGSKLTNLLEKNGFQIKKQYIEKFCLFVCIKN